jgi:hypothetical protein
MTEMCEEILLQAQQVAFRSDAPGSDLLVSRRDVVLAQLHRDRRLTLGGRLVGGRIRVQRRVVAVPDRRRDRWSGQRHRQTDPQAVQPPIDRIDARTIPRDRERTGTATGRLALGTGRVRPRSNLRRILLDDLLGVGRGLGGRLAHRHNAAR